MIQLISGQYDIHCCIKGNWVCFTRTILNYLRTDTLIRPKSADVYSELLLEAEYYQITSLIRQLKLQVLSDGTIIETLQFDLAAHHPHVAISDHGTKASHGGSCQPFIYAKVADVVWGKGRHYWEIILEAKPGMINHHF